MCGFHGLLYIYVLIIWLRPFLRHKCVLVVRTNPRDTVSVLEIANHVCNTFLLIIQQCDITLRNCPCRQRIRFQVIIHAADSAHKCEISAVSGRIVVTEMLRFCALRIAAPALPVKCECMSQTANRRSACSISCVGSCR